MYWIAFDAIDVNKDRSISFSEFMQATDTLQEWGIDMKDPIRQWNEIDADSSGKVSFHEFCLWAIIKNKEIEFIIEDDPDEF